MATPHVAGAAALLAQRHPDRTGAQLKDPPVSTADTALFERYWEDAVPLDVDDTGELYSGTTGPGRLDGAGPDRPQAARCWWRESPTRRSPPRCS